MKMRHIVWCLILTCCGIPVFAQFEDNYYQRDDFSHLFGAPYPYHQHHYPHHQLPTPVEPQFGGEPRIMDPEPINMIEQRFPPVLVKPLESEERSYGIEKHQRDSSFEDEPIELTQRAPLIINNNGSIPVIKPIHFEPSYFGSQKAESFQSVNSYPMISRENEPQPPPQPPLPVPINRGPLQIQTTSSPSIRIVPISAVDLSAQMVPFVAGDLLPSHQTPEHMVPVVEPLNNYPHTMPVVAGSFDGKISPSSIPNAKASRKGGYNFEPVQPATLPPLHALPPTQIATSERKQIALPAVEQRPAKQAIVTKAITSTTEPPPDYISSDEGTVPELIGSTGRASSDPDRPDNRKLYSCNGKRFIASEKEVGDVKCCGAKAYKWRHLICSAGDLFDPNSLFPPVIEGKTMAPPIVNPMAGAKKERGETTPTIVRLKTRAPYIDYVASNGHQHRRKPHRIMRPSASSAEHQQGLPFIQPDALPNAMIAAYFKHNPLMASSSDEVIAPRPPRLPTTATSSTTSSTTTTTTTEMPTTSEIPTTAEPILIQHRISEFEVINFQLPRRFNPDPDQIQVDPPSTTESAELKSEINQGNGKNDNKWEEFQEVSVEPETTPKLPPMFSSGLRNGMTVVRCNRQDWPISEPVGTYICCGDMLFYTLLDPITCNDEIHQPLVIEEEHFNRAQQLFDVSSMNSFHILPPLHPMVPIARNSGTSRSYHTNDYYQEFGRQDGSEQSAFCDNADPRKFCCGDMLYDKEFGQVCCEGNYGFSRAGTIQCCGALHFDARTHECSESGTVVHRQQHRIISYFI